MNAALGAAQRVAIAAARALLLAPPTLQKTLRLVRAARRLTLYAQGSTETPLRRGFFCSVDQNEIAPLVPFELV